MTEAAQQQSPQEQEATDEDIRFCALQLVSSLVKSQPLDAASAAVDLGDFFLDAMGAARNRRIAVARLVLSCWGRILKSTDYVKTVESMARGVIEEMKA